MFLSRGPSGCEAENRPFWRRVDKLHWLMSSLIHLHSSYEVKGKGLAPDHLTEVTEINGFAGHVRAWQRVRSPPSTSVFYSFVAAGWERKYTSLTWFTPRHADINIDKFTLRVVFWLTWLKIIPSLSLSLCWNIYIHATTFKKKKVASPQTVSLLHLVKRCWPPKLDSEVVRLAITDLTADLSLCLGENETHIQSDGNETLSTNTNQAATTNISSGFLMSQKHLLSFELHCAWSGSGWHTFTIVMLLYWNC